MIALDKIRNLPENKRKIILWVVVVAVGLGLIVIYFLRIQHSIRDLKSINLKERLKMPNLGEEFKSLPKLEISTSTEEELKKLEAEIQKNEEENQNSTLEQQATTTY